MGLADWLRTLSLAALWGCAFFLIEIALRDSGPLTIVLVRVGLAALVLTLYCLAAGTRIVLTRSLAGAFVILGLIHNAVPFTLIALGQTQITSALAAILIATTPLFTVATAHFWGRVEPATPNKIAGILIGIAGVAVLVGPDVSKGLIDNLWGQAAVLVAAASYALGAVYARRLRDLPASVLAAGMLATATAFMLPPAFLLETPFSPLPGWAAVAAMAALALAGTALAYILYFRTLASAGATNVMLVTFLQPAIAILLGVWLLGEPFELHHLAGLGLILGGLALVDGRVLRLAASRA